MVLSLSRNVPVLNERVGVCNGIVPGLSEKDEGFSEMVLPSGITSAKFSVNFPGGLEILW